MLSSGISTIIDNLPILLDGLLITVKIAFCSIVISLGGGIIVAVLNRGWLKWLVRLHLELFRIIPMMVWLIVVFFTVPMATGLDFSGEFTAILVFSLWGAAEMGDLARGALESLPRQQTASGKALGLSTCQIYVYILIPQAIRRMLPGGINLSTRMIKTTSLIVLIGAVDLVKRGQQVIERTHESLYIYGFLFVLYFLMCYPLSQLAKKLESKWAN